MRHNTFTIDRYYGALSTHLLLEETNNHQVINDCSCSLSSTLRHDRETMNSIKTELSPPGSPGPTGVDQSPESLSQVLATSLLGSPSPILEDSPAEPIEAPPPATADMKISHVHDIVSMLISVTKETGQMDFPDKCECLGQCDCLTKKNRRIKLYNTRKFYAKDLVTTNEEGIKDYSLLIEHTKLIHEFVKDLLSCHQAYEMAKKEFLDHATASERERIRAKDKEYEPKILKAESDKPAKLSPEEKKIRDFMKLGLDRMTAEKIIFAR